MGVPKFFRWISERYPKINCPLHCPPNSETRAEYFPDKKDEKPNNPNDLDPKEVAMKSCLLPEFDRLYLDMNGIIHCASHNNASELNTAVDPDIHIDSISNANPEDIVKGCVSITEEEIFRNVAYYLDRIVCDIAQPKELVFLSIDGVAPRAKMNQQRGRRYRSGQEKQIEDVFYGAMQQQRSIMNGDDSDDDGSDDSLTRSYTEFSIDNKIASPPKDLKIQEVEPGRFAGTFQTSSSTISEASPYDLDFDEYMRSSDAKNTSPTSFHSNTITPGTEFFENFTNRLEDHLRKKLDTDSRWAHLTVILSGPGVPGEGEHKIMDFIRREKRRKDYNRNTRHCLYGQDGDLIMLGLTTHEPNFCLLREEVIFDQARKRRMQLASSRDLGVNQETDKGVDKSQSSSSILMHSIDSYVNNASFELLHMSVLRDYIAYEFETKEVLPENSSFELEPTIDDFVFMTFFVGNDFMPHMPALDIQDEAFELLFYAYKRNRHKWVLGDDMKEKDLKENDLRSDYPYLTRAGEIVSGKRLESFLRTIGRHEDPYYDNKKRQETFLNERIRKADEKAGRDLSIPSADSLAAKEAVQQSNYMTMLESIAVNGDKKTSSGSKDFKSTSFTPVTSNSYLLAKVGLHSSRGGKKMEFKPEIDLDVDEGLISKMGSLIKNSLTPNSDSPSSTNLSKNDRKSLGDLIDRDIKGRYYYEKFKFSPVDGDNHLKLRQAYIQGLVWTLAYYYKGCKDWEWFYPFHYGPMLSDLINIEHFLKACEFSRTNTEPLKPFEQLMACLPPSSSYLLPKPFQWLMRSSKSPIKEFYPESFTVDMNGKRWPWEAVILLPFIDSKRLVQAVHDFVSVDHLTSTESKRNLFRDDLVFVRNMNLVTTLKLDDTQWGNSCDDMTDSTNYLPVSTRPGFPTLREVPVQSLIRRKVGINVFGMRSRYKSAILQLDSVIPQVPGAQVLASRFIGTTVFFRYPFFHEGYVTAVSDPGGIVRGKEGYRVWSSQEKEMWQQRNNTLVEQCETGEGFTGSGGCNLFNGNCIFYIRPLKSIRTLANGSKVKVYARVEVDVPIVSCLWSPTHLDPRLVGLPALLEKNPFQFGPKLALERLSFTTQGNNKPEKFRFTSRSQYSSITREPLRGIYETVGINSNRSSLSPALNLYPIRQKPFIDRNTYRSRLSNLSTHPFIKRTHTTKSVIAACVVLAYTFFSQGAQQQHVVNAEIPSLPKMKSNVVPYWKISPNDHSARSLDDEFQYIHSGMTPPLEFAHGTTTISFTYKDGIIAAVDSRASIGNFVGSKTTKKILEVNNNILGTMAGGAADCSFWIRKLQSEAKYQQLVEGKSMTVARASRILANALYRNRGADLSIGTMIMGFDDQSGPSIYYVDSRGVRTYGDMFAVGSGSTFAISILDTERRHDMSEDEAVALGIKAIRHATFRDAFSGGYIGVYVINKQGWRQVFSEDIAASSIAFQR